MIGKMIDTYNCSTEKSEKVRYDAYTRRFVQEIVFR